MGFIEMAKGVIQHVQFRSLMEKDLSAAIREVNFVFQTSSPEELEAYVDAFLEHASVVVGVNHRVQAMRLYGYLQALIALRNVAANR